MADQVFAVNSGFYDAVNSDRTYSANDMNRPYKRVVSNGVFATPKGTKSTDLQVVSANNGMQIIVNKGEGIFADKWLENSAAINITVPANTSTVPRIDSVIVQVDKRTSGRVGNIVYRTGTPSVNPTAPSINTVSNVIEYRLANVRVETGTTAITTAMITDRRGSADCPWVTSLIYQVDTSILYDQWAAAYEEYFETEKEMWDDWYNHLTEELDVSMTLIKHTSTFVTTQETSEITIGISDFNANTDMLEVYINGMRAIEGSQYTINENTSILLSAPLGVGQTVNFVCLKSVIMGNPDDITHVIEALEQRIASITGGVPTVVDSTSAMTDTDKIYILTTDSKWYYYNLTSSSWVAGGVYGGVPTDTTLTQSGMAADAYVVGNDISNIKSDLNRAADIRDSDAENVDLDISDINGNVVLRLADGEIKTKNFDSSNSLKRTDIGDIPQIKESEETTADLDVSDIYGNVLMRMSDGEIETKKFRGFSYRTFSDTKTYTGTLPFTLTVNHHFSKGDHIVLHVDRGTVPWDAGAYVNYYVGEKHILDEGRGDDAWIEYVVTEDVDSVSAVYTGTVSTAAMTSGVTFTFEVSLLGDIPITPTIVTVKQDGSGDYTTLRGALDSIGFKANDVLNPYRIEIYPGVYDVLADYTDEEIANANYDLNRFVGPVLYNGMWLVGMGNAPEETVLTASLDPETWSNSIRGVISPLNCQGSCGFENMTIKAYNLRYCVHDDYTQPLIHRNKRIVKNVILRGYNVAYTPCTTYGAGTRYSTGDYYFENCDFGENAGLHTSDYLLEPTKVHLINCVGHGFRIGDNVQDNAQGSEAGRESEYRFDNCDFLWINQRMVGSVPHVIVRGSGGVSPLYQFDVQTLYATGDVVVIPNSGKPTAYSGLGTVLEWYSNNEHGPRFRPATSYDTAHGIVVWEDSEDTYIQTKGYVRTDRTGITTFSLGDYVGMSNGSAAVVSNADTAFGRITYVDNTGAGYIKLDWKE